MESKKNQNKEEVVLDRHGYSNNKLKMNGKRCILAAAPDLTTVFLTNGQSACRTIRVGGGKSIINNIYIL